MGGLLQLNGHDPSDILVCAIESWSKIAVSSSSLSSIVTGGGSDGTITIDSPGASRKTLTVTPFGVSIPAERNVETGSLLKFVAYALSVIAFAMIPNTFLEISGSFEAFGVIAF